MSTTDAEPVEDVQVVRPAHSVVEALRRVMADLPGIGKDETSPQGYNFRGIEAITLEAQPLFAKHGVVFTPHVLSWEIRDLVVNNRPWTDTILMVEYTVYGPHIAAGNLDGQIMRDRITVGPILAIGRDNSDKGANKAMTQAFKYALIQTLCISDKKDDGDAVTHEAEFQEVMLTAPVISKTVQDGLLARIALLSEEQQNSLAEWFRANEIPAIKRLPEDRLDDVEAMIDHYENLGRVEQEERDDGA